MTYGEEQQYMVDGLISTGDAFIDSNGDSTREWRSVALATMRRGGRGLVALDLTQPDPISSAPDFMPVYSELPGCLNGATSGCDGEFPRVMWEFSDTSDADSNCPTGMSGDDCAPYWDLGWTWSKPAIARIAVYNGSNSIEPNDIFVAFFGGGWDATESDATGNHFYGVDLATGDVIFKYNVGVALPGSPTALDSNQDGFHDRIYFADSNGGVWRLEYPEPTSSAATGAEAGGDSDPGTFVRIFDFRTAFSGFPDRQQFFTRPVTIPTVLGGDDFTWALALGSGNRADLGEINGGVDHFYFLLDVGDTTTRGAADLVPVNYFDLDGSFICSVSALDPNAGNYGWYLNLRPDEKVMSDSPVIDGHVLFTTFDPTPGVTAQHNVPNQCGGDPPPDDGGDGDGGDPPADGEEEIVCKTSGIGRRYDLWFQCGMGEYGESNTPYSGIATSTTGETTTASFTKMGDDPPDDEEFLHRGDHVVTNWRQE